MNFYNNKQPEYNDRPASQGTDQMQMGNMNQTNMNQTRPTGQTQFPVPIRPPQLPVPPPTQASLIPPGEQAPQTVESIMYTPGYLRTQIGRMVRVEFLIGTSGLNDRIGTLLGVGASYILIRPIGTNDIELCDIYSIKFVTIYYKPLEMG